MTDEHPAGDPFEVIATQDELDTDIRKGRASMAAVCLASLVAAGAIIWAFRYLASVVDWLAGVVAALV